MTLMGTGTSHGIPVIACHCKVCTSTDPKDTRYRCSAYITQQESDGHLTQIVIDTGPEFRLQAIRYGITDLDAVLLTHSHADHLHGLDDLRVFSRTCPSNHCTEKMSVTAKGGNRSRDGLAVYANPQTIADVENRFDYVFKKTVQGGGIPKLHLMDCTVYTGLTPLFIGSLRIIPVPLNHGELITSGYLISHTGKDGIMHSAAYLTDCNSISKKSLSLIKKYCGILDDVVIDGLRYRPHATHCSFDEALYYANLLSPLHTWLIHICHDMCHTEIESYVKSRLFAYPNLNKIVKDGGSAGPAWDGLVLQTGEA